MNKIDSNDHLSMFVQAQTFTTIHQHVSTHNTPLLRSHTRSIRPLNIRRDPCPHHSTFRMQRVSPRQHNTLHTMLLTTTATAMSTNIHKRATEMVLPGLG